MANAAAVGAGKPLLPAALRRPPSYLAGGIPRLLHQMFLPNAKALRKQEAVPLGNFRRDWRRSCQVHNPGWRYVLWDTAMAEWLLEERYPWFLDTFKAMDSVVVKSDAMRPFILHAYGGVYLDMDIECFGPLEDVFGSHSLVLQAQEPKIVNNGQMASVAGHPMWLLLQQRAGVRCKETIGKRLDAEVVMQAVGPWALTEELRKYLRLESAPSLPGVYPDEGWATSPLNNCSSPAARCVAGRPAATSVRIYSPKQWFEACTWDDLGCQKGFAECSPFLRALNTERALAQLGLPPSLPQPSNLMTRILQVAPIPYTDQAQKVLTNEERRQLTRCFLTWGNLSGVHQFSGSWMATGGAKGDEHKRQVLNMASQGLAKFLRSPDYFVELQLPDNSSTSFTGNGGAAHTLGAGSAGMKPSGGAIGGGAWAWAAQGAPAWLQRALGPVRTLQRSGAGCHVLALAVFNGEPQGRRCCEGKLEFQAQTLRELAQWASASRCALHVLSNARPNAQHPALAELAALPGVTFKHLDPANAAAAPAAAAAGKPVQAAQQPQGGGGGAAGGQEAGRYTSQEERQVAGLRAGLLAVLRAWRLKHASGRLTMLHVSGSSPIVWGLFRQLNVVGGRALLEARPHVVMLDTGPLPAANQTLLQPACQHLYQELGLLGHMHAFVNATAESAGSDAAVCIACFERPDAADTVLPMLRLALSSLPRMRMLHRPLTVH